MPIQFLILLVYSIRIRSFCSRGLVNTDSSVIVIISFLPVNQWAGPAYIVLQSPSHPIHSVSLSPSQPLSSDALPRLVVAIGPLIIISSLIVLYFLAVVSPSPPTILLLSVFRSLLYYASGVGMGISAVSEFVAYYPDFPFHSWLCQIFLPSRPLSLIATQLIDLLSLDGL